MRTHGVAPGVQPQCQGATPVKRSPGRQPKLLFPYRWAHKLALPYPTSAQESVSHLLSGHTHAPKDLLSLLVTHTHTHTHSQHQKVQYAYDTGASKKELLNSKVWRRRNRMTYYILMTARERKYDGMPGPGTPESTTMQRIACHQSKLESWAKTLVSCKHC